LGVKGKLERGELEKVGSLSGDLEKMFDKKTGQRVQDRSRKKKPLHERGNGSRNACKKAKGSNRQDTNQGRARDRATKTNEIKGALSQDWERESVRKRGEATTKKKQEEGC